MVSEMTFFTPPPVRWTGAKWQLADWIIAAMPEHDVYCEPYCGGAAVFFRKPASKVEVINDLDGNVINFFQVLRERPGELIRAIDLTPYARAEYELSYQPTDDPLERARRFYVLTRMSFASYSGRKTGWRTQRNIRRRTTLVSEWQRLEGLELAVGRLKDAIIENDTALNVIARYDTPQTCFYVDPPYVMSTRSQGRERPRYAFEMTDVDHRELAAVLQRVTGSVLLSGYDSDLYRELYSGWACFSKTTTTNGNSQAVEYLWLNEAAQRLQHLPLFRSEFR